MRAPTIGAATPGRSRTQASATSSGATPSPSAAVRHGVDDPAGARRRGTASTKPAKCGGAAARVGGRAVPVLAGQHAAAQRRPGQQAEPERRGGRHDLALDAALQQRVLDLGGHQRRPARPRPLPGRRLRGLPAGVVRDPGVAGPAGARPRGPARTASPRAGVSASQVCTCHRSTWSMPSRCSERVERAQQVPREASTPRSPCRAGAMPALVATTTSSRPTTSPSSGPSELLGPRRRRSRPRCRPACRRPSTKAESWSRASCSSVSRPQVIVPSPSRETCRPLRPSRRCSMGREPTDATRGDRCTRRPADGGRG